MNQCEDLRPVGNVNASLWKSFYNDRLRLSLQSNIWAKGRKSRTEGEGYTSFYHNATRPTSFTFSLTWSFSGGKNVRQCGDHRSDHGAVDGLVFVFCFADIDFRTDSVKPKKIMNRDHVFIGSHEFCGNFEFADQCMRIPGRIQ